MSRFLQHTILWFLPPLILSGCGFKPLYGDYSASAPQPQQQAVAQSSGLSDMAIELIPDRSGQVLRNDLIDRFYRNGYPAAPTMRLKVDKLSESITELDLTKSSEATRAQLTMKTSMTLVDSTGKVLLSRPLKSIASYNILGSEFATRVTKESARQNAIGEIARQIELNLMLYFNNPAQPSAATAK